jgi:hypothetical protein
MCVWKVVAVFYLNTVCCIGEKEVTQLRYVTFGLVKCIIITETFHDVL